LQVFPAAFRLSNDQFLIPVKNRLSGVTSMDTTASIAPTIAPGDTIAPIITIGAKVLRTFQAPRRTAGHISSPAN
jgi:hypothetical protein